MFHSSLNIPFLNDPMFWRTLLTTVLPLMLLLGRMSLGRINRPSRPPFFSVRASEIRSFPRGENGVLVSLRQKGTGLFPGDEKICLRLKFVKNSVCRVYKLFWKVSHSQSCIQGNVTED